MKIWHPLVLALALSLTGCGAARKVGGWFGGDGAGQEATAEHAAYTQAEKKSAEQLQASFEEGRAYFFGLGVTKDSQKALDLFYQAASGGLPEAQMALGSLFYNGDVVGRDYQQGLLWYTRAAEQGYTDAQLQLGYLYMEGRGVDRNPVQAVEWFTKAAKQNNAEAQLALGEAYGRGEGVKKNYKKAARWLRKAVDQDNEQAKVLLGSMYLFDDDDTMLKREGDKLPGWFTPLAEQGNPVAQYGLGCLYASGIGVEEDLDTARLWLNRAAAQGHPSARHLLGVLDDVEAGEE